MGIDLKLRHSALYNRQAEQHFILLSVCQGSRFVIIQSFSGQQKLGFPLSPTEKNSFQQFISEKCTLLRDHKSNLLPPLTNSLSTKKMQFLPKNILLTSMDNFELFNQKFFFMGGTTKKLTWLKPRLTKKKFFWDKQRPIPSSTNLYRPSTSQYHQSSYTDPVPSSLTYNSSPRIQFSQLNIFIFLRLI